MEKYDAWRMVGKDIDVTAAAVGEKETTVILDEKDGEVIGLSVAENYARIDLAKCLLTLDYTGEKPVRDVALTQFLPDGERQMWPVNIPVGIKIKAKLVIRTANTAVATPITLIFHHKNPKVCN